MALLHRISYEYTTEPQLLVSLRPHSLIRYDVVLRQALDSQRIM